MEEYWKRHFKAPLALDCTDRVSYGCLSLSLSQVLGASATVLSTRWQWDVPISAVAGIEGFGPDQEEEPAQGILSGGR